MENKENLQETLKEETEVNNNEEVEEVKSEEIKFEEEISELKDKNKVLKDENKKLENELNSLKDRFLRMNAEYENFRKRTEKEKKAIYTDACSDVLNNMFPAFDNLERAIVAEGNAEDLKKGIEAVMKQFIESLSKLDVEEIGAEGEFDPNYHNAIMHVEDESLGENQIVEVFQKGFKRGDKVLRYSLVKVAN
ncbi:nucleotide exchange factor GrpE [Clostridium ganghwense]|uniref:Protein GrpE n=1 Tax=Clostridium ganghwense TaxID=312089 RepID=A0ABT4CS11_9CLOT|nr:nucleotide exchange factor GrpE [Clostridium ganghwense]MCY6371829.1 nucleotide exchange factor GrpE [Clostridium ganghwense]